jgi:hypothetical protein
MKKNNLFDEMEIEIEANNYNKKDNLLNIIYEKDEKDYHKNLEEKENEGKNTKSKEKEKEKEKENYIDSYNQNDLENKNHFEDNKIFSEKLVKANKIDINKKTRNSMNNFPSNIFNKNNNYTYPEENNEDDLSDEEIPIKINKKNPNVNNNLNFNNEKKKKNNNSNLPEAEKKNSLISKKITK